LEPEAHEDFMNPANQSEDSSTTFTHNSNGPERKKKKIDKINNVLSQIKNVSYDVVCVKALEDAETNLQGILTEMKKSCSIDNGLIHGNNIQRPRKLKIKRKAPSHFCDELPRKYPKLNPYASRFGETAEKMKPLHAVTNLNPTIKSNEKRILTKANNTMPLEDDKEVKQQLLPHAASFHGNDINKNILNNGPHYVSFLQLKSLETTIATGELNFLKAKDKAFEQGWLYDKIINGYLWRLCQEYQHCLYASSIVAKIQEKNKSIKLLWNNDNIENKTILFIPWNPSGYHWILLVVKLSNQTLLFLDPNQKVCASNSPTAKNAVNLVNRLLKVTFNFTIELVTSPNRIMQ